MKSSLLLLLVVAAVVVGADGSQGAFASAPGKDSGASHCGSVPEDGEQWLQPLCKAIHRIAAGKKEDEIKVDDGTTVRSAELWRNENGTTIDIDFRYGAVGSHVIARLLSGSTFIPVDRVDQLVVRNAVLDGTLDLSHATIEVAAKFDRVVFNPRQEECYPAVQSVLHPQGPRIDPRPSTPDPEADALVLLGSDVKKRLSVENSIFCGSVRITSSQLHGGLQLGHGPDAENSGAKVATWFRSLVVAKSNVQGEILIGPVETTNLVRFDRSTIDALTVVDSEMKGALKIIDNQLGALSIWSSIFGGQIFIEENVVGSSMNLRVVQFLGEETPVIRDNDVNGGLQITLRELAAKDADFSHNTVDRSAEVWLARAWRGSLDMNGSVFGSRLALCLAELDGEKGTLRTIPAKVDPGLRRSCRGREGASLFAVPTAMAAAGETVNATAIDLRSVKVGTLAWRLPLSCSFRWAGSGLHYQHWEETPSGQPDAFQCREHISSEEDVANSTRIGSTDGLMLMRHLMKEDDIDALNTMADYLESRGKIVESRDIREEAKRANYSNIPDQAGFFDAWSRRAASVALAPVGYGAKPELALIWLFGIWLGSFCIYTGYSHTRRKDWPEKLEAESAAHFDQMKVLVVRRPTDQPRPVGPQEQPAAEAMIGQRAERQLLIEKRDDAGQRRGYSLQPGFMQFDKEKDPKDFDLFRYSIDAMVPVINLHTYDRYYPEHLGLRLYAALQHALGWFLITIFLISAAIL